MEGAGHYDWGQGIDVSGWAQTVQDLIRHLPSPVAFLCHDEKEYHLARELHSGIPAFFPKTTKAYFETVADARAIIANRMHAVVAFAGMGVPGIAVCTDTRLLMVEALGLPAFYAKDASLNLLTSKLDQLIQEDWQSRFRELKRTTRDRYVEVLREYV